MNAAARSAMSCWTSLPRWALNVTIRGIAERSGCSTGVIGHYFRNRKDPHDGGLRRAAEILSEFNTRVLGSLEGMAALSRSLRVVSPSMPVALRLAGSFFFYIEAMHEPELLHEVQSYLLGWRKSVGRAIRQVQKLRAIFRPISTPIFWRSI